MSIPVTLHGICPPLFYNEGTNTGSYIGYFFLLGFSVKCYQQFL